MQILLLSLVIFSTLVLMACLVVGIHILHLCNMINSKIGGHISASREYADNLYKFLTREEKAKDSQDYSNQ